MAGSRRDTWMPFYWGDYLRDTMHLDTEGHGAYVLLIAAYWTRGEPLPDDDKQLLAITRLNPESWKRLKPTLRKFFTVTLDADGTERVWRHKRVDAEISRTKGIAEVRREAGKRGGKAKAKQVANSLANAEQTGQQNPTPSPKRQSKKEPPYSSPHTEAKERRSASDTELPPPPPSLDRVKTAFDAYNEVAERVGWPIAKDVTPRRRTGLASRVEECGGLDEWRALLKKAASIPGLCGDNDRGWRVDLDFFLQQSSFTKLREGSYDHWRGNGKDQQTVASPKEPKPEDYGLPADARYVGQYGEGKRKLRFRLVDGSEKEVPAW